MEALDGFIGFMLFLAVGLIFVFIGLIGHGIGESETAAVLGGAICEQEYGREYESYNLEGHKILKCKEPTTAYDGIKVKLGGD